MVFCVGMGRPRIKLLEVTVDRCYNLEDRGAVATEYSCLLEYGGSKKRTKPCLGGGRQPVFEETLVFEFTEGVLELNIWVLTGQRDQVTGFLRVQLQPLLSDGYVGSTWSLQTTNGRPAGYIRLALQFPTSSATVHNLEHFQRQNSSYTTSTFDPASSLKPDVTQPAILSHLLPYDSLPPSLAVPRPNAPHPYPPNFAPPLGPAALASSTPAPAVPPPYDVVPYPPPTQPMSCCPPTSPPAGYGYGYPLQPHHHLHPNYHHSRLGPSSGVYPPPPH